MTILLSLGAVQCRNSKKQIDQTVLFVVFDRTLVFNSKLFVVLHHQFSAGVKSGGLAGHNRQSLSLVQLFVQV
jgi:hypothetical protein